MNTKNKGFYERYKIEQKNKEKEQELRSKYNIDNDKTIVIENKSKMDKFLSRIVNISEVILKAMLYIGIFCLSSIGATVLMNETLRETLFDLLKAVM